MNPTALVQEIINAYQGRTPLMVKGPPGVGKSDAFRQACQTMGISLLDIRLSQWDPADLRGIPYRDETGTHWSIPAVLPRDGAGIILFDEFMDAVPLMRAASLQMIWDRRLDQYVMPDGWVAMAAGNRAEDRAAASRMKTQEMSRFDHVTVDVDQSTWIAWAFERQIDPRVIGFIKYRPELLHSFDPRAIVDTFPCPRTWEKISRYLTGPHVKETRVERIQGIVGEGAGIEFAAFLNQAEDLPDPEDVLRAPDAAPVPTAPDALYALCTALAARVAKETVKPFLQYSQRVPSEYSVLMVEDGRRAFPDLIKSQYFVRWAADHQELFQ